MRVQLRNEFIQSTRWHVDSHAPLAGDASPRRYQRLTGRDGTTRILMDAPPDHCGPLTPFLKASAHLNGLGFSVPEIFAVDEEQGWILMEDLGDAIYARVLETQPSSESELYLSAIKLLAALHAHPTPVAFKPYTPKMQADLSALSFEWYHRWAIDESVHPSVIENMCELIVNLISYLGEPEVFTHRDFHAENLIWLPDRQGVRSVGLLDFQDGMRFHPAYDLISLIEDARRDVSLEIRQECTRFYCELSGMSENVLDYALSLCGAQRNLRIIGVFARLAIRDGKHQYLQLLPRVWHHLRHDLSHPSLVELKNIIISALPPPSPSVLERLRTSKI